MSTKSTATPAWLTDTISACPPIMKKGEVAKLLRLSERQVNRLAASGRLKALKSSPTEAGHLMFPRAAVAALLLEMAGE